MGYIFRLFWYNVAKIYFAFVRSVHFDLLLVDYCYPGNESAAFLMRREKILIFSYEIYRPKPGWISAESFSNMNSCSNLDF